MGEGLPTKDNMNFIKQGKGMTKNYDETIPGILENLTGNKGQPVSLGKHQSGPAEAFDNKTDVSGLMFSLKNIKEKVQKEQPKLFDRKKYQMDEPSEWPKNVKKTEDIPEHLKMATLPSETYSSAPTAPVSVSNPLMYKMRAFVSPLLSRFDRIARHPDLKGTALAEEVTSAMHRFAGDADLFIGQFGNKSVALLKNYTVDAQNKVRKYVWDMQNFGSSPIMLAAREKRLLSELGSITRDVRKTANESGLKLKDHDLFREGTLSEIGYIPDMLDRNVAQVWAERPFSDAANEFDKLYIKHVGRKIGIDEAKKRLNKYKAALGNKEQGEVEFAALRRSEGQGLPWELVDKNLTSVMSRYGRRAGNDLSFWKNLQSNPRMRKALNLKDQTGHYMAEDALPDVKPIHTVKEVQQAMRSVHGITAYAMNPYLTTANRLAANLIMGPLTAAKNLVHVPAFTFPYLKIQDMPNIVKALAHAKKTYARAFNSNATKASFAHFDAAGVYEGAPNPVLNFGNRLAQAARSLQLREFSDWAEANWAFSLGDLMAPKWLAGAMVGDKEYSRTFRRLSDLIDPKRVSDLIDGKTHLTVEDIDKIAKRFTDLIRGTYGPEGLPSWALEGPVAPFLQLSRFSLEKSNNIWKDVFSPLSDGIYGPFMRFAFGALVSGVAVEKLTELFNNKRGPDPTWKETFAEGNAKHLAARLMTTIQYGEFAGIVTDMAKLASTAATGGSAMRTNPLAFPVYNWVTEILGQNIGQATGAIVQGEDFWDVMWELMGTMSTRGIQGARILNANFGDVEEVKKKEALRDLRIYNQMTGLIKDNNATVIPNPYLDISMKGFKKTTDIDEALEALPQLLDDAFQRADGDYERFKRFVQRLKGASFASMPSPEQWPMEYVRYFEYLEKTQGNKAARERERDYMERRLINQVKSSLVP